MVKRKAGLIVEVVEQPGIGHHGQFFDLMESRTVLVPLPPAGPTLR
jgi:hypothetical protein